MIETLGISEFYEPYNAKIFPPAGTTNLLKDLKEAFRNGFRKVMLHGPAGTGKTLTSKFFINWNLGLPTLYIRLPLDETKAQNSYLTVKSLKRRGGVGGVGVVVDELEKTKNYEVVGWVCEIAELPIEFFIGITNRPWVVLRKTVRINRPLEISENI